jgi:hypothetical protein
MTTEAECKAHYWIIDDRGYGICKLCNKGKQFDNTPPMIKIAFVKDTENFGTISKPFVDTLFLDD